LDIWERTQGDKASTSNVAFATGVQIKDKDFDTKDWAAQHNDLFEDLIAKARTKVVARKAEGSIGEKGEAGTGSTLVPAPTFSEPRPNSSEKVSIASMEHPSRTALPPKPDLSPGVLSQRQTSPIKYMPAQPRSFQDTDTNDSIPPSSSQYQGLSQNMDNDSKINSDKPTIKPLQP